MKIAQLSNLYKLFPKTVWISYILIVLLYFVDALFQGAVSNYVLAAESILALVVGYISYPTFAQSARVAATIGIIRLVIGLPSMLFADTGNFIFAIAGYFLASFIFILFFCVLGLVGGLFSKLKSMQYSRTGHE